MNTKIQLGNTMNDLAVLKLEYDKLRTAEDRRHAENDHARAREKEPEQHIVVFDGVSNVFSNLADGVGRVAGSEELSAEEADKLDGIAKLIGQGASFAELAAGISEDLKTKNEDIRQILASMPYAQDQADFLSLLDRLSAVLTNQKPANG